MQHYFIDKEHLESDYFEFKDKILSYDLCFRSCDSIFSKNKIDDGTRALVEAIDKKIELTGFGLDLGCGLGALSIPILKRFDVKMLLSDINATAVSLTRENLIKNGVSSRAKTIVSNGFENIVDNFDFIISNPPIKVGKKVLFELMDGCFKHLLVGGKLVLVIRKDLGMESLKKHLIELFDNCEIVDRNKGYYILISEKHN